MGIWNFDLRNTSFKDLFKKLPDIELKMFLGRIKNRDASQIATFMVENQMPINLMEVILVRILKNQGNIKPKPKVFEKVNKKLANISKIASVYKAKLEMHRHPGGTERPTLPPHTAFHLKKGFRIGLDGIKSKSQIPPRMLQTRQRTTHQQPNPEPEAIREVYCRETQKSAGIR